MLRKARRTLAERQTSNTVITTNYTYLTIDTVCSGPSSQVAHIFLPPQELQATHIQAPHGSCHLYSYKEAFEVEGVGEKTVNQANQKKARSTMITMMTMGVRTTGLQARRNNEEIRIEDLDTHKAMSKHDRTADARSPVTEWSPNIAAVKGDRKRARTLRVRGVPTEAVLQPIIDISQVTSQEESYMISRMT